MPKYFGHPEFYEKIDELKKLHSDKNHDYCGDGDPLGNFHRVASLLGFHPAKVALIYMMKQVDAVADSMIDGRELKVEGLKGRLQDIAVYATLMQILLEENDDAQRSL